MPEQFNPLHSLLLPGLVAVLLWSGQAVAETPTIERQGELRNLLYQDCGSCHGMRLTGGLGPSLTAVALRDKPRNMLVATVRDGRSGTPMPPWKFELSDADIEWLVDLLKNPEKPQ